MVEMARFIKPILAIVPAGPDRQRPAPADAARGPRPPVPAAPRAPAGRLRPADDDVSASDFLDQWFETDPLKATMSASGIIGTYQGVQLARHGLRPAPPLHGRDRRRLPRLGHPEGRHRRRLERDRQRGAGARRRDPDRGPGRADRRQERPGDGRRPRERRGDRGDRRPRPRSTPGTFLDLLEPGTLDAEFEEEVRRFKFRGSSGKVNLAVDRLPDFTCLPGVGEHLRGAISFSPSIDEMEQAYDDAKYGRLSSRPYIDMIIPTLVDPSMAPPGKHVISCFVQYAPYKLAPELGHVGRPARGVRRRGDRPDRRVRAEHPRHHPRPQRPDAARHRADDRPDRGQHLPGRAEPRAAVLQPAGPRLRPVPDADPRPVAVRLGDPPGRRDHGRERADRGARGPPVRAAGRRPDDDGLDPSRPPPATTRSSSAAATTASSPRRTSPAAGLRRSSSSARDRVGGAADTERAGARRPRPDARPHRRAAAAVGRPRARPQAATACALVAPEVRVFAPAAGRPGRHALGRPRAGPSTRCAPGPRTTPTRVRRVRPAASASLARFLAELGGEAPPDIKAPGLRRRAPGPAAGSHVPRPRQGTTGGRSCASCRWPSPTSSPSRSRPTRSAAPLAWRGVRVHRDGPVVGGHDAVLLADAAGNDGGAAGETVFAQGGPGALADGARRRRARGRGARSGPAPRSPRSPRADGAVDRASCSRAARRSRARASSRGLDPKQMLTDARATRSRSGRRCAGGPATSGRPGSVAKVNLVLDGLPEFPAAGGDDARCSAAGSWSHDGDRRDRARLRRREVRPASPTSPSSRRRSRRSSTRRSSTGRPTGPTS